MFFHENRWYVPGIYVKPPTDEDKRQEEQLEAERQQQARKDQALARARELGLGEEDLAALMGK
jgi:hypothetical protein